MLRLPALILGIAAALAAWLALGLGAVRFDRLGAYPQLVELGFFLETGSMILGAAICSSRPRTGALLLLFGSFGWAVTTALAANDNLLVPTVPLALGTLAAILAVPRRKGRRRDTSPTRLSKPSRRASARRDLIEPQFSQDQRQRVQWQRTDAPPVRYRRRKSGWLGVVGTVVVVIVGAATAFAVVMFSDPEPSAHRPAATVLSGKAAPPAPASTAKAPPSLAGQGAATNTGVSVVASISLKPQLPDAAALYRSGDKAGAVQVWRVQALAGDTNAQFSLATAYQNGDGVAQDATQAAVWFQKAASQGLVSAETSLATAYYLGTGVAQDYAQALHWFEQAAAGGDSLAQFSLGQMYRYGQGAPIDLVASWAWLEIAAEAGEPNAVQYGSEVYAVMTGAQIEEAKKLVLSWRSAHPLKK